MIQIRQIANGYLFIIDHTEEFHEKLESLFKRLLLQFEGNSEFFGGSSYGSVKIFYKPNETFTSPPEMEPV